MDSCSRCRRNIISQNSERHAALCDGDPASTCVGYGCGLEAEVRALAESDGTGRMKWLSWCLRHTPPEQIFKSAPETAAIGPRQRLTELAERR